MSMGYRSTNRAQTLVEGPCCEDRRDFQMALLHFKPEPWAICHTVSPLCKRPLASRYAGQDIPHAAAGGVAEAVQSHFGRLHVPVVQREHVRHAYQHGSASRVHHKVRHGLGEVRHVGLGGRLLKCVALMEM